MATSGSARVFCICMQRARQFAQAYSNDRRSHCVRANHRLRSFGTRGRTGRGNACQTPVARTSASVVEPTPTSTRPSTSKGAVMSLGTCWRRCLGERPLGAPKAAVRILDYSMNEVKHPDLPGRANRELRVRGKRIGWGFSSRSGNWRREWNSPPLASAITAPESWTMT